MRFVLAAASLGYLVSVTPPEAAEAASPCKLDGSELVAVGNFPYDPWNVDPITRKDLVGTHFRVEKVASKFRVNRPSRNETLSDEGVIVVVAKSDREQFFITQEYNSYAVQYISGASYPIKDKVSSKFEWSERNREAEKYFFTGQFKIYSGPLSGLILNVVEKCVQIIDKSEPAPSKPMAEKQPQYEIDFINRYAPYALLAAQQTGMSARVILAQASLASDWGRVKGLENDNNIFGVKATASNIKNGMKVKYRDKEETTVFGKSRIKKFPFIVYPTPEQSFEGFVKTVNNSVVGE